MGTCWHWLLDLNSFIYSLMVCRLEKLVQDPTEGNAWHADHIVPVFLGGDECRLENMRTLCVACHADVTLAQGAQRYSIGVKAKKQLKAIMSSLKNAQETGQTKDNLKGCFFEEFCFLQESFHLSISYSGKLSLLLSYTFYSQPDLLITTPAKHAASSKLGITSNLQRIAVLPFSSPGQNCRILSHQFSKICNGCVLLPVQERGMREYSERLRLCLLCQVFMDEHDIKTSTRNYAVPDTLPQKLLRASRMLLLTEGVVTYELFPANLLGFTQLINTPQDLRSCHHA
ncbi:HNH endonuclease [Dillenia turbinata]|uniref:HNH endonuclease n=1 Tax=Dillenia turbinata TaxID=194707 RepID=A0AAN8UY18_9MAGN